MTSNRTTLEEMDTMPTDELSKLPVQHLAMLCEDVADLKAKAKRLDDRLFQALDTRYAAKAAATRRDLKKDTGTVRLHDDDHVIVADLPKKVEWNKDGLVAVEQELAAMGEPVADYIVTTRAVPERAYVGWPSSLRKMFEPHRTLGTGKPTYKIEKRGDGS